MLNQVSRYKHRTNNSPIIAAVRGRLVVLLALPLILVCCRPLPEYALPAYNLVLPENGVMEASGLPYRQLKKEDFQAKNGKDQQQNHAVNQHLNAHTLVRIRPVAGADITVVQSSQGSHQMYTCNVRNVRFEALMIPSASFWNPAIPESRTPYVLQHEQVHFDLAELAVRRLNRLAAADPNLFVATEADVNTCQDATLALLEKQIRKVLESTQEQHLRFDMDTSGLYNPAIQQWWSERIGKELHMESSSF